MGLLSLILLVSIYYFFYVNARYSSKYISALNLLLALFTVYGAIYMMEGSTHIHQGSVFNSYTYLVNNYTSLLPIYPLYAYTRKGLLDENRIKMWIIPFLVVVILTYFFKRVTNSIEFDMDAEAITNNIGFVFVSLVPLLYLLRKKPLFMYAILMIIAVFVVSSMKRGAMVILVVSAVIMLYAEFKNSKLKGKLLIIGLSCTFMVFVYLFTIKLIESNEYFAYKVVEKTMEGSSSGRDNLYETAIDYWINKASPSQFLLGTGANKTYDILGNRAHNDWLELAVNQGLIGIIVYLIYWLTVFSYIRKRRKAKDNVYYVLLLFSVIYFLKSLFSMSYDGMEIYSCLAIAWSVSEIDKDRQLSSRIARHS